MSKKVKLSEGNGGVNMQLLVDEITGQLDTKIDTSADAVEFLTLDDTQWLTTTDGFSVDPLIFPGGSIGSLAVNGTVNDLAVSGATPKFLTLNVFLEEGFEKTDLKRIMQDFSDAARISDVSVIAGDTKVLPKGEVPGILMATTGIGRKENQPVLGFKKIKPTDVIVSSGSLGDHGAAVLLAREEFGLSGQLNSCCASVLPLTQAAMKFSGLKFMRDPTRGGLTTVVHDIYHETACCPRIMESSILIKPQVRSICSILGYDPLVLASEGRVIAVVSQDEGPMLVECWQKLPEGTDAAIIGYISENNDAPVLITALGGEKYLPELVDDPLPRIC